MSKASRRRFTQGFYREVQRMIAEGLITQDEGRTTLTPLGKFVAEQTGHKPDEATRKPHP